MRICLSLIALTLIVSNALAADPAAKPTPDKQEGLVMEQEVTMQMPGRAMPPQKMVFKLKGLKMRMDVGPMMSMIIFEDGRTATVMHLAHSYMIQTMSQAKEAAERAAAAKGDAKESTKPIPTGQHLKIRGNDTDEYTINLTSPKGDTKKLTIWVATNFPDGAKILAEQDTFHNSNKSMKLTNSISPGLDPKQFPNGVTVRSESDLPNGGKMIVDMVSAKMEAIEDSEFELPQGYQQQDTPTVPTGQ